MTDELALKIGMLPESPGCYLMKAGGEIIYVGKAKNLRNRVRQYFQSPERHTPKVRAMVEKVEDFDIVLVDTDLEAFALECNLIKLHMPRYNIVLKDDKHYPYIRLNMHDEYPRAELVRKQARDGARYFGPYHGSLAVREVLDTVRMVFPIRSCTRAIVPGRTSRPCMYYQTGQCPAPCMGFVSPEEYRATVEKVADFLSGRYDGVLDELRTKMKDAALSLNYERAAVYRDRIQAVESVMQKQQAISTTGADMDVIAVAHTGVDSEVQLMMTRSGRLIGSEHFVLECALDDPLDELMTRFITQYYSEDTQPPREVLLSCEVGDRESLEAWMSTIAGRRVYVTSPRRGDKVKLISMAMKNLRDAAEKRRKKLAGAAARTTLAAEELGLALGLAETPHRIEGYDISNTQGAQSVASMVVSIDGVAAKKEYRHFRIKTVEGANDFASMNEVLRRRLSHGLRERQEIAAGTLAPEKASFAEFPDLILVDGGKGQLSAALEVERELGLSIPMFGLAKRIDEIVLPDREESLLLDRHSNALHLIERLRDEAHRFAITHHRTLRARHAISSVLDGVSGVGPNRRREILRHFKSAEELRHATAKEIGRVPGLPDKVAADVYRALHPDAGNEKSE